MQSHASAILGICINAARCRDRFTFLFFRISTKKSHDFVTCATKIFFSQRNLRRQIFTPLLRHLLPQIALRRCFFFLFLQIYLSLLVFCVAVAEGRGATTAEDKKPNQRDVYDAETQVDYAFSKIPVYVIPNTPPAAEGKVPVALIPGAYPPSYVNVGGKEAKHKYAFYAPYKVFAPFHFSFCGQRKFRRRNCCAAVGNKLAIQFLRLSTYTRRKNSRLFVDKSPILSADCCGTNPT